MESELRWDESSILGMTRWLKNCDQIISECEQSIGLLSVKDLENIQLDDVTRETIKKVRLLHIYPRSLPPLPPIGISIMPYHHC